MKSKLFALFLALTVTAWAQTTNTAAPLAAQQENAAPQEKAACGCCEKMASSKDGKTCCHRMAANDDKAMSCGHEESSCCKSKDAKSCMKGDKDKVAAACCGKDHEKGCCASHGKEDAATNSCQGGQCGEHCAAHSSASPGN